MDAIELLKNDHKKVRGLLTELEETTSRATKTRTELLPKIKQEIEIHAAIEEEIFYPAFQAAAKNEEDRRMVFEALAEHKAAGDVTLQDLAASDINSDEFGGKAKVLKELIEHHAKEEEQEMFPRARELLGKEALQGLGEQMAARKLELGAAPE
jgi:hemerythrin superfamily protein